MFLGHFGVALAGPAIAPRTRLWHCMLAALWLDALFPVFTLVGLEHAHVDPAAQGMFPVVLDHLPWSHGLLMTAVWCALAYALVRAGRLGARAAIVIAALVFSHWVLDAVAHRGDMMIGVRPGSARVGLYLWDSIAATLVVELGLFAVGMWALLRARSDRLRRGQLAAMAILLVLAQIGFVFAPPPPAGLSSFAIAAPTLGMLVPVVWAAFLERPPAAP